MRTARARDRRERAGAETQLVPEAEFAAYYGRPVVKEPVWGPDIPSYLFLGGLAGASSALAASAQFSGHPELARVAKTGAAGAISLSLGALVHDLGRPARFLNMLRVLKVTSPMSIGTWLLSAYAPLALTAAGSSFTPRLHRVGVAATGAAAALGPAAAAYTSVLLADTAAPAWHDAYRELPYLFAGSAATAAGGLGLLAVTPGRAGPAARLAALGAASELAAERMIERRLGLVAEAYRAGPRAYLSGPGRSSPRRGRLARCWAAAAAQPVCFPGPRCWPDRRSPGSPSSKPDEPRPGIRGKPSSRNATAWTTRPCRPISASRSPQVMPGRAGRR